MNIKNKNNFLGNSSRSLASTSSARDAKPDREHPEQKLRLEVQRTEKPPVRPSVFAGTEHPEQDGTHEEELDDEGDWEDGDDGWEDDEPTPVVKSSKTVMSSYKISPTSGGNLNWPSSFHSNMGSSSRSTPVTPVAQSLDWSHYGLLHQVEPRPIINPPLPVKSPERPKNISNSLDFYHESSDDKCYDELPDDYVFEEGEDWGTLTWPLPSTGVVAAAMDATLDTEPLSAEISSPLEKTISDAVNAVIDDVVDSADPVFAALEAATQFRPVASRDITSLVPKAVGTCLSALASGNQPIVVARSGSTGIVGFINGLIEVYKTIIVACDNFDKSMRVHPGWNVVTSAEHIVNGRVNLGETRDLGNLPEIVKGSFIVVVVDFDNWTV